MKRKVFELQLAKKKIKQAIDQADLWAELGQRVSRHPRTVKRWFHPKGRGMPVECILICQEYPALRRAVLFAVNLMRESLEDNERWYLQFSFQIKDTPHSSTQTAMQIGKMCQTYQQLPNHSYQLTESADDRLIMITIQTPYRPELVRPIGQTEIRYIAPHHVIEPDSGLNYNQLIEKLHQEKFQETIAEWIQQTLAHCQALRTLRMTNYKQKTLVS